jgi:hypothetical protein
MTVLAWIKPADEMPPDKVGILFWYEDDRGHVDLAKGCYERRFDWWWDGNATACDESGGKPLCWCLEPAPPPEARP